MHKIQIIGAGQLGSRHLQALASVSHALSIDVIDPSPEALAVAQARYEALPAAEPHHIQYHSTIPQNQNLDILIVASGSKPRRQILEEFFSSNSAKYVVLEKILFANQEDYSAAADLLKNTKAWVNCCMRMMPAYEKLQDIYHQKPLHYSVTGSQYGLITNAIHYLDHVAWLTGCDQFELNTDFLDQNVLNSKRSGYLELSGTLIAQFENKSFVKLHASQNGNAPLQIDIHNDDHRLISREWEQLAWQAKSRDQWQWHQIEAKIPYQSEMTSQVVRDLIETGNCALTPFSESSKIHFQLLEPLKQFLKKINVKSDVDYPFT